MTKRKLNSDEIDSIIDSLTSNYNSLNIAKQSVVDNNIEKLKSQLIQIEIYPEMIEQLKQKIKQQYFTTKISPGENVGILVAQSIGEKQTQMSVGYEEYVFVKVDGLIKNIRIGVFIDSYFMKHKDKVVRIGENNWVLSIENENVYTISVSSNSTIGMKKITMLSRHSPNGNLYKFTTSDNKTVLSTGSHSLLTLQNGLIIPIKAFEVTKDTLVPFFNFSKNMCEKTGKNVCTGINRTLGIYMKCGVLTNYDGIKFYIKTKKDLNELKNYCVAKNLQFNVVNNVFTISDYELYYFILNCKSIPLYILSKCNYDELKDFVNGLVSWKYNKCKIKCITNDLCDDLTLILKLCFPNSKCKIKYQNTFYYIYLKNIKTNLSIDNIKEIEWKKFDDIQIVKEEEYSYKYVYDFSVDDYETFMLSNGLFVHNTLNTFHTAGLTINTVVTGVPRLLELMNTTKEPKSSSCTIPISDSRFNSVYDIRNFIGPNLRCLTLSNITDDFEILKFQDIKDCWWLKDVQNVAMTDDVLRLKLSPKIIYENRCSLEQIVIKLNEVFTDVFAISSSLNDCIIDVFITNKNDIALPKKQVCYITEENKFQIFFEEVVYKKFEKFIIYGIEKIKDFSTFTVKPGKEWVISTMGSNLKGLMECGLFDPYNITSNNMWEIYHTLGVEATREFLINEFINVISSDGTFINKCHVLLLVDFMTFKGDISSISRYSLRSKNSPLSRSSFEESIENFLKSGIFSEVDNMKSISANIMTGKLSYTGTGICDLLIDTKMCFPSNKNVSIYNMQHVYNNECESDINSKINTLSTIFEEE